MAATKMSTAAPSNPFIKQLASSNRTTRDRALSALRSYLSTPRSTPLTPLDLLKLWKGLFYCMFMSDKPRNQQALARDLAALTDVLPTLEEKIEFLKAFWNIMAREWSSIDYLRMDKYLYLVRCLVAKGFETIAEMGWDEEGMGSYMEALKAEGGPLSPRDVKVPNGLRLHVLDVWVDELEKVDGEEKKSPVDRIMEPLRELQIETLVKSVRERAAETLGDERLVDGKRWRQEGESDAAEEEDAEDAEFGGFEE